MGEHARQEEKVWHCLVICGTIKDRERSGIMGYRPGKAIWGIYAPQEIADRVNKYREEHKRTLTYVVLEAVDEFLKSKGY